MKIKGIYNTTVSTMWETVLNDARTTVGKFELNKEPSDQFKRSILKSQHSPIRGLIFDVLFYEIPVFVTQQFSRHHIALRSNPDMQFDEKIDPTDLEHFVQTSRSDRTNFPRHERRQDDNVKYKFRANAQGLIDASKKRLCLAADPAAIKYWKQVKKGVKNLCPELADVMQPHCVHLGHCPEDKRLVTCKYDTSKHFKVARMAIKST